MRYSWLLTAVALALVAVSRRTAHAAPELSDEDLRLLSEAEVIEVWDERRDKPFDRDTALRLTGEELAQRGATDLATALALLPDVSVRAVGRGGVNIDIRGARKGSVRVLIDGVSVSDPFYGTFDISTIPITDIVQIRVSTTALSPIDGPGGPGGVIEVHTRDAIGTQLVLARLNVDTLPSATWSGGARAKLAPGWGLRVSATGNAGVREFTLPALPSDSEAARSVAEGRRAATFALRLEHRDNDRSDGTDDVRLHRARRRMVLDLAADDRRYLSPPSETKSGSLLLIDRETTLRGGLAIEQQLGRWQGVARAWTQRLQRRSRNFRDAELTEQAQLEDLQAWRVGGQALVTRALRRRHRIAMAAVLDHERATVLDAQAQATAGTATVLEVAANGQTQTATTKLDAAVGVAVPFGIGVNANTPWLDAKLVGRWQPHRWFELVATIARKGRPPTLRERYDRSIGNPTLGPEIANAGEVRLVVTPPRLRFEAAPYVRQSTGTTRVSMATGKLENVGQLRVIGIDLHATATVRKAWPRLRVGAAYTPVRATTDLTDGDALDRLPRHRGEGWLEIDPSSRWSVRLRLRSYGESLDQGQTVPGATLVDGSVAFRWSHGNQATLRIDDAFDNRPELRTGFRSPGRTIMTGLALQW